MTQVLEQVAPVEVRWHRVCPMSDLELGWAEAALVGGRQVALFPLGPQELYAVDHRDPGTGAHVMARGITGSRTVRGEQRATVTSPLHKEVYDLVSGACYTEDGLHLPVHACRVQDGWVEVGQSW
ncbi:nitrite reductase (NAD(P)H) small subunit [Georgenia sp. H159]|uniref:nitrite reductase (NAD(P)H) small subunit n=1 Tax=Georgenia sp. H159 TaxID=3076115 RepID=UPI002D78656D|nr:nitrite reductase (NAD(P)H) small subunit [Georgenia sp. H159]